MKLKDYLKKRNKSANALTLAEAKVIHINYPLEKGWVKTYGDIELSAETLEKLHQAKGQRYSQKSYKKSKAQSKRKGRLKKEKVHKATKSDIELLNDAKNKLVSAAYKLANDIPRGQDDYKLR